MEAEAIKVEAFQMAIRNSCLLYSLLFYSDWGVQYACSISQERLEGILVVQSMSKKGNCWDNAMKESFFKTKKTEIADHHHFATR
ncbi:hypothetical protein FVR03_06315 [Pontibacter qinzhouensis]|uniref:Integrase catalytic domain-containing protein n=1 Tax=Pontibacter qinzhouensis TaxID=2603253 RepID=A0A5C8KCI7_9BACT|nr:hypothetical protein [Pontibacter qinzhouensis]TXK49347.1 hypothetical protein FVR03_06315 [Pontibacter qinzhouensis]